MIKMLFTTLFLYLCTESLAFLDSTKHEQKTVRFPPLGRLSRECLTSDVDPIPKKWNGEFWVPIPRNPA